MVIEKGPSIGKWHGYSIPDYIVTDTDGRYEFNRTGIIDEEGGFEMSQLGADECVIAPGLIYRRDRAETA